MIAPPNCIAAIDVSAAQGTIDGARIAAAGIALAWVEIGVGNDRPNACRAQQVASLRAAGIRVRPYGFAYALPPDGIHLARDPVAQVALWLNEAEGLGLDPYEPWEDDAEWPAEVAWARWGDSAGLIRSWHLAALAELERRTTVIPTLYASPAFAAAMRTTDDPSLARYPLTVAQWGVPAPDVPAPWGDWSAWQYSSDGHVDGIEGPVDLSWVRVAA